MAFLPKFPRKLVGILLVISGSICTLGAGAWSIYTYHFVSNALRADGQVIQLIQRHSDNGDLLYPVFKYTDQAGNAHTIDSNAGSYPAAHQVGDSVTVLYIPGAEGSASLDDWFSIWGIPVVLGIIGISHLAIGAILCFWLRILRIWRPMASG